MIHWCARFVFSLIVLVNKRTPCVTRVDHLFCVVKNSNCAPANSDLNCLVMTHKMVDKKTVGTKTLLALVLPKKPHKDYASNCALSSTKLWANKIKTHHSIRNSFKKWVKFRSLGEKTGILRDNEVV